ncbi:MAG: hypothetical protein EOL87_18035 [Spartobacteria bacterium]|nr:hypothetical protein [Spartobacteria bacterium]
MKKNFWKSALITMGLALCVAPGAEAYIEFFGEESNAEGSRTAFVTAIQTNFRSYGTEDLEDNLYSDDFYEDNSGLVFESSLLSAYIPEIGDTSSSVQFVTQHPVGSTNRYPTSGYTYVDATSSFSIEFDTPISAFGFFLTDLGDFSESLSLSLHRTTGELVTRPIHNTSTGNGGLLYYGFQDMSNLYTKIEFNKSGNLEWDDFGLDDMTVAATPVPVPPTAWMLGSGLLGLIGFFKFNRRTA